MQNIIVKIIILSTLLLVVKCTDILNNDSSEYNSIHLKGGGWLQFNNQYINSHLNSDFSLQLWISGKADQSNDSKTLLAVLDEDNNNEIIFGLFRNTTVNNGIDIFIEGNYIETITDNSIDWTQIIFNLITVTSEETDSGNNIIKVFINNIESFSNQDTDLQLGDNNLIIGGKVNSSQTVASNFWTGYIDEIRLWSTALTSDEVSFHFSNPSKLVTSADNTETEDVVEGTYEDARLCHLAGLWRFNYNNPTSSINDESCLELDLTSGASNVPTCDDECENINGIIYTLPGYNVEFSKTGL